MSFELGTCAVRVESLDGIIAGTGFVVASDLVVTCVHIVTKLGVEAVGRVQLTFQVGGVMEAEVLADGWHPEQDVAFLRLSEPLPEGALPAMLGPSAAAVGSAFRAFGYPDLGKYREAGADGKMIAQVTNTDRLPALQLRSQEITHGISGAPVLDIATDRVVGMVTETYFPDATGKFRDAAYAIPAETLVECAPVDLALQPGEPQTSQATFGQQGGNQTNVGGNLYQKTIYPGHSSPIPHTADSLPEHFVARPDITTDLEQRLLSRDERPGVLPISVLHGPGGAGKSTLASALAHCSAVRQRFPNGVLWASLGQEPRVLSGLIKLIRDLGDSGFNPIDVDAASSHLRSLLASKNVLLVIDDAWDPDHVEPFRVGGTHCHLLITTRRTIVAEKWGAPVYEVEEMTSGQALELLSSHLEHPLERTEKQQAERFAERVGCLPQALELGAVQIRKGKSWSALSNAFEEEIARLEVLEDTRYADRRDRSLLACMNLSLETLREENEDAWHSFAWLSLLPKGVEVAAPATATLWDVDEKRSLERLELLYSESLLLRSRETRIGERKRRTYRVQDVLHDMASRVFTAASPDGLGMTFPEGHVHLLERYRAQTQNGQWHTLPDDGYIYEHLAYHLEQAGEVQDLLTLFSTPDWMRKRHKQEVGYHAYLEDLWQAQRVFEDQEVASLPERVVLSYLEWRVRLIYKEMPENLLKLYSALGGDWETRVIPAAQLMPELGQRVRYLSRVGSCLICQGRMDEAHRALSIAIEMYLTSSEADFREEHDRRWTGNQLAEAWARIGEVCYLLLDSIGLQYEWLNDKEPATAGYFIDESLKRIVEALGLAGAAKEANELIEKYLSRWPAGDKSWHSRERNKLLEACIRKLLQGHHYEAAEVLLTEMRDSEAADRLWAEHLGNLNHGLYRQDILSRATLFKQPKARINEQMSTKKRGPFGPLEIR